MTARSTSPYDSFAKHYHLVYRDWHAAMNSQGLLLSQLIGRHFKAHKKPRILDASCGIGTQAIGLAKAGIQVHACDPSPTSVSLASKYARELGVEMSFGVSSFQNLKNTVPGQFDIVLSCDNSLPHLLQEAELRRAAKNIRAKLSKGGFFLLGMRDYDTLLKVRPQGSGPAHFKEPGKERVYFQTWRWRAQKPIYDFQLFLLQRIGKHWKTETMEGSYRAWRRKEINQVFIAAGFSRPLWLMPEASGFSQPLGFFRV